MYNHVYKYTIVSDRMQNEKKNKNKKRQNH